MLALDGAADVLAVGGGSRDFQALGRQDDVLVTLGDGVVLVGSIGGSGERPGDREGPAHRGVQFSPADENVEVPTHGEARRGHRPGSGHDAAAGRHVAAHLSPAPAAT